MDHAGKPTSSPAWLRDDQAQLRRPVQDAEGADVIKIHS